MNVLLLDQFSDPGGAQLVLLDTLAAIRERGWRALVGLPGSGDLFRRVRELGFEAERIDCGPYQSGAKTFSDLVRFGLETTRLAGQIQRLTARAEADLVYINGPRVLPAAGIKRTGRPVLFHAHSYLPRGIVRQLAGLSLRRTRARVVGACQFVADPWAEWVGREQISIVYNGVAGPAVDSRRAARNGKMRAGCIGRVAPEKGQLDFVEVARRVRAARADVEFAIYGAPLFSGSDYDREVRAAALGLDIPFAGWRDDVYSALAELDVLLVPSFPREATTRVILEAFAAGVPVIAYPSGGIPEVVENGVNGLLVRNAEEMARAVVSIAEKTGLARAGHDTWERRFTLERYKREIAESMERILSADESK